MWWNKIIKSIPFLFQLLLVIGGVLVFAFFDPFGIFISSKTKLKDTPVDVRNIRSIGKLITAEYYGEVIGSYAHEVKNNSRDHIEEDHQVLLDLLKDYTQEINQLHDLFKAGKIKRREAYSEFNTNFSDNRHNDLFQLLLYYIHQQGSIKNRDLDNSLKQGQVKRMVQNAIAKGYKADDAILQKSYLDNLLKAIQKREQKNDTKRLKKSNLVLLGRGWVKAGFDFGQFDQRNFKYNKKNQVIYLIGIQPTILSATINPWFIPEQGIEGFEFLVVDKRARRDDKILTIVKQRCLDELIRKSQERDILVKATANAKDNLREFFSLLLQEQIKDVYIFNDMLQYSYHEITKNDTINGEELLLINNLLQKNSPKIHEPEVINFVDSLLHTKSKIFLQKQVITDKWSPVLGLVYDIAKDGQFDAVTDSWKIDAFTDLQNKLNKQLDAVSGCTANKKATNWLIQHCNFYISKNMNSQHLVLQQVNESPDTITTDDSQPLRLIFSAKNIQNFHEIIASELHPIIATCE